MQAQGYSPGTVIAGVLLAKLVDVLGLDKYLDGDGCYHTKDPFALSDVNSGWNKGKVSRRKNTWSCFFFIYRSEHLDAFKQSLYCILTVNKWHRALENYFLSLRVFTHYFFFKPWITLTTKNAILFFRFQKSNSLKPNEINSFSAKKLFCIYWLLLTKLLIHNAASLFWKLLKEKTNKCSFVVSFLLRDAIDKQVNDILALVQSKSPVSLY